MVISNMKISLDISYLEFLDLPDKKIYFLVNKVIYTLFINRIFHEYNCMYLCMLYCYVDFFSIRVR